jgi:hypothetical protein
MGRVGDHIEANQVIGYRPIMAERFPLTPDTPSQATSGQSPYNVDPIRQSMVGSPSFHSSRPPRPPPFQETIGAFSYGSSPDSAPLRQHPAPPRHRPNGLDWPWLGYHGHPGALSTGSIEDVGLLQ